MKLHLPRRRILRAVIYIGCFLLVLIAADMLLVQSRRRIRPGFATTRITAPLKPDGSVDYLSAVDAYFGVGITPQNNAAVLMLQALGPSALAPNRADGVCDRLGMQRLPEKGDYFIPFSEYCKLHSAPDTPWAERNQLQHWPIQIDQISADWVGDNARPLALISDGAERPRFFIPLNSGPRLETMIEIPLPYVGRLRDVSRALQTDALIRINSGDLAGYRRDMLTIHRLARLIGQSSTMVERLVAIIVETAACQEQRVALASGKIPPDQARAMADELAALGDLAPIVDIVDKGERYFGLDTLQVLAQRSPSQAGRLLASILGLPEWRWGPPQLFLLIPIPYEQLMREINRISDEIVVAMREQTYPRRYAALRLWAEQVTTSQTDLFSVQRNDVSLWDLLGTSWPLKVFVPSLLAAAEREEAARVESDLTQIALLLSAFKAARGTYPAALGELVPEYRARIPVDGFSERPLIYARTTTGYALYSVGPNMNDDGGKTAAPADDIVASAP